MKIYQIKRAAEVYRAINHKLRQQILCFIHEKGCANVALIAEKFHMESTNVSHHIAILRDANILHYKRTWRNIYYSVHYEMLQQITDVSMGLEPEKYEERKKVRAVSRKRRVYRNVGESVL